MAEQAEKLLHADSIAADIVASRAVDVDVVVHDRIDSTNSWSLQQCKAGKDLPFACFAEEQAAGRGRRGKSWLMPAYSNIAMSLSWPFVLSRMSLHLLPLSISIAVAETLENIKLADVQVKWPNDVYVGGKKIAGILIETQAVKNDKAADGGVDEKQVAVVIGVGLNYDMSVISSTEPVHLPVFTDICSELDLGAPGRQPERPEVASLLLQQIVRVCQTFQQDAQQYLDRFRLHYDFCTGKYVDIILDNGEKLSGMAQGVNDNAELLVLIDGQQRVFNSAEVSVKAG